ncbi:Calvin cycle protein CP12 [Oculatella sp. LEGE 06141]|uniref:Calvin cycle protein CP12 n=1 Tax=Oculatella sp. LEGE 06141 TaxID=1828648 RepID=UPI00187EBD97|nr:Calvin cycle protein CP12 [Oculatella sp. LEGE 06141]MBE9176980.1 Calvin cycle protein CP12 [Oculatella sp. LEGE 06141]
MPKTLDTAKTIEQAIHEAVTYAREACDLQGSTSSDCAVAWDIVEELQAERSHQKSKKTSLEHYCDENPDASECRIYDV